MPTITELDGFESGRLDQVTQSSGNVEVGINVAYSGIYGLIVDGSTRGFVRYAPGRTEHGEPDATARSYISIIFRFQLLFLPGVGDSLRLCQLGTDADSYVTIDSNGDLYLPGSNFVYSLDIQTWYTIAVSYKATGSSVANALRCNLYDGPMDNLLASDSNTATITASDDIYIGKTNDVAGTLFIDDIAIQYQTTDSCDFPLLNENYKIIRKPISGNGTDTGWTGDYTNVDEIPTDDATGDVCSTAAADTPETFVTQSFQDIGVSPIDIRAIKVSNRLDSDNVGTSRVACVRMRSGGTIDETTTIGISTTNETFSKIYNQNPDTSTDWDESTADDIEVGVRNDTLETFNIRLFNTVVQVLLTYNFQDDLADGLQFAQTFTGNILYQDGFSDEFNLSDSFSSYSSPFYALEQTLNFSDVYSDFQSVFDSFSDGLYFSDVFSDFEVPSGDIMDSIWFSEIYSENISVIQDYPSDELMFSDLFTADYVEGVSRQYYAGSRYAEPFFRSSFLREDRRGNPRRFLNGH